MAVVAAVLATGIWAVTMIVATVGVGSVDKVRLAGKVGLLGIGSSITLTLNLLFTGLWLSSSSLPSWVLGSFLARSFYQAKYVGLWLVTKFAF